MNYRDINEIDKMKNLFNSMIRSIEDSTTKDDQIIKDLLYDLNG